MFLNKNTTPFSIIKKSKGLTVNEVQHPKSIFSKWSEAELNAINLFTITEDAIPSRRYYTFNEVLNTDNATITRSPIARPTADIQALMLKDLEDTANSKFNAVTVGYTAGEMSSWRELEDDAIAHQTTPLISGMLYEEAVIGANSIDAVIIATAVDELATKVRTNATAFKQAKSFISGTRKKVALEITALISVAECVLYERAPYNYTITAEDIANDIEGSLVLDDVVIRYANNVKDW